MSESTLPLMRSCFFGGAMHAVFLLQKGYGDQLASDIASFILEQPRRRRRARTFNILIKIGFSLGSAAIEMTAWLFSLPTTKTFTQYATKSASRILIGAGSPRFERAPQRRRCFDGEANAPHA